MLLYDLADPVELQGFVRTVAAPQFRLINEVLPSEVIDDLDYRFIKGDLTGMDIATYRAFDAEADIGTRAGVSRVSGELPPISKKMILGEEQRLRLRSLLRQGGAVADLSSEIFNDAERLAIAVLGRLERAAADAVVNGQVQIQENGVEARATFGYTAANRKVAALSWLDPNADVVGELTTWVEAYSALSGGRRPAYMQLSLRYRNALLRNNGIRSALGVGTGSPALVTQPQLNSVLEAYGLPTFVTYDTTVRMNGQDVRTIAEDIGLLMPPDGELGRTFYGTTAEALELVDARQIRGDIAAGLVAVNLKTFDPVHVWTKVAGISIPTVRQPGLVIAADLTP